MMSKLDGTDERDRQTETDRQTDRQTETDTDRYRYRQTDRQKEGGEGLSFVRNTNRFFNENKNKKERKRSPTLEKEKNGTKKPVETSQGMNGNTGVRGGKTRHSDVERTLFSDNNRKEKINESFHEGLLPSKLRNRERARQRERGGGWEGERERVGGRERERGGKGGGRGRD